MRTEVGTGYGANLIGLRSMASVFGHAVSAIGFGNIFPKAIMQPKVFLIGITSSMLPDLDVISGYFGIWGLDMLGHRGMTHSIFFAALWASILVFMFHRSDLARNLNLLFLYYFMCTVSHGLIDGMTNGGDGITYFAPFSSARYHLPWNMIQVSPLGAGAFFSEWGLRVIKSELIWIGIPSLILMVLGKLRK